MSFGGGAHLNSSGPVHFAAVQPAALPISLVWPTFRTTNCAVLPGDSSHGRPHSVGSAVLISGATTWMWFPLVPSLRIVWACWPVSPEPRRPLVAWCPAEALCRRASRAMVSTTAAASFPATFVLFAGASRSVHHPSSPHPSAQVGSPIPRPGATLPAGFVSPRRLRPSLPASYLSTGAAPPSELSVCLPPSHSRLKPFRRPSTRWARGRRRRSGRRPPDTV